MRLGADMLFWSGGTASPKAYVQDGLIGMWDGEWNVGPGKHDARSLVWRNLGSLGSSYDARREAGTFSKNGAEFFRSTDSRGVFMVPGYLMRDQMGGEWTVEVVFTPRSGWFENYSGVFGNHGETKGLVFGQYENGDITFVLYSPLIDHCRFRSSDFLAGSTYSMSQVASSSKGTMATFRNASQVASSAGVDPRLTFSKPWTCIGAAMYDPTWGSTDRPFDGFVHCVRVYDRPLSASEVQANCAVDLARFLNGGGGKCIVIFGFCSARPACFSIFFVPSCQGRTFAEPTFGRSRRRRLRRTATGVSRTKSLITEQGGS